MSAQSQRKVKERKEEKDRRKGAEGKKKKSDVDISGQDLNESLELSNNETPQQIPKPTKQNSQIPSTQATIKQLFGAEKEEKEDKVETGESIGLILKSLEAKMNNMITVDHLQTEFKKLITEKILTTKLGKLQEDLKKHFKEELDKVYDRIGKLEQKHQEADKVITTMRNDLSDMEVDLARVVNENRELKKKNKDLKETIDETKYANKVNEMHVNELEQYTRRNNIRIYGIDDRNKEESSAETTTRVINFLKSKLDIDLSSRDINIAHRIGRFREDGNRVIICRFVSRMNRNEIIKKRTKLKGTAFVIREDLTNKNAKLLEQASDIPNVTAAWTDQGRVIVLLDSKEKTQINLMTDLSMPIEIEKNKKDINRKKADKTEETVRKAVVQ